MKSTTALPTSPWRARILTALLPVLALGGALPAVADGVDERSCAASPSAEPGFVDVTQTAGVFFLHQGADQQLPFTGGPAIADFDGDGWDDIYLCNGSGFPNMLFRNNGDGTFTDLAKTAGVEDTAHEGVMGLWADLDGDGLPDLFVANQAPKSGSRVYRNRGDGTFEDRTAGSGAEIVQNFVGGVAAADYDRDGDVDLAFSAWVGTTIVLRNDGNFHFTKILLPGQNGDGDSQPRGWQPMWIDLDEDGWLDLYLPVDFFENRLFINNRHGAFTEQAHSFGLDNAMNDMGITFGDYDNDGDLDFYITNIQDWSTNSGRGHNVLFENGGGGRWTEMASSCGVADGYWGWGTTFFDYDNDGWQDLYEVNGWISDPYLNRQPFLWRNQGDKTFASVGPQLGVVPTSEGRGVAAFDPDNDGDQDLIFTTLGGRDFLFRNDVRTTAHWLDVEVRGPDGRGFGEGAEVVASYGGRKQARLIAAGSSFQSQEPNRAHFGLGSVATLDELFVRWPGVGVRRLTNVPVDRRIQVRVGPRGDADGDGMITSADGALFDGCRQADGVPYGRFTTCWIFDADGDGDVDVADGWAIFGTAADTRSLDCCPARD